MIKVGDIVWGNESCVEGLPYRARVEEIREGKAKLKPLEPALTGGSTRALYRKGPSLRPRWVKAQYLRLADT